MDDEMESALVASRHVALDYASGARDLVDLEFDHPGAHDPFYRARRKVIARAALEFSGEGSAPRVDYTPAEHAVWATVWEHMAPLHERYAFRGYRENVVKMGFDKKRLPQLADVNQRLEAISGFRMLPVTGLISSRTFLAHLARGVFLSTQYVRHHSQPLFTPEPDVVHELLGHATTMAIPQLAELYRAFGAASLGATDETIERISRAYWFFSEVGIVAEEAERRVVGAALLSSAGEIARFERAPLSCYAVDEVAATSYDPREFQPRYFVASSLDAMVEELTDWLAQIEADNEPEVTASGMVRAIDV